MFFSFAFNFPNACIPLFGKSIQETTQKSLLFALVSRIPIKRTYLSSALIICGGTRGRRSPGSSCQALES